MQPIVSVIMPVYNAEKYIKESVQSIINQSFDNFEFIIINDGSTDKTADILHSFTDLRIHLLSNEKNIGNFPCRNQGLRVARGKYIAVMDADDIAMSNRLAVEVQYLDTHPDIQLIGTNWSFLGSIKKKEPHPLSYDEIKLFLLRNSCFLHPSLMVRKSIIQEIGGYDEQYVYAADYDLLCRMALYYKIENIPPVLIGYRWHPNQITQKFRNEQRKFANEIRRNYQMQFVSLYKTGNMQDVDIYILGNPLLAECICRYIYAKYVTSEKLEKETDKLMDIYLMNMKIQPDEDSILSLCQIGCGLLYLLNNGFVKGDECEILSDIDKLLDKYLSIKLPTKEAQIALRKYNSSRKKLFP